MSLFKCDLCPRTYTLEKNLKRHIREGHTAIEYWLCVQSGCVSKFVRRSYSSKHLMLKHEFNKLDAHSTACQAPRGDIQPEEYYDDVSDDASILDLIEEMDQEQYEQHYMNSISNFKIPDFNNNDVGTSNVNIRNEGMVSDKSSFQVIMCDQYSDISSFSNSDHELDNDKMSSELDYFDKDVYDSDDGPIVAVNDFEDDAVAKGDVSDEDVIGDGDDADKIGNVNEADDISDTDAIDNDNELVMVTRGDEFGNDDEADEFGVGDEVDEFGNGEDADEFGNGDEADKSSDGDELEEFGNGDDADEFGNGDEADEFSDGGELDEFGNGDEADEFGDSDEAMANGDKKTSKQTVTVRTIL